MNFFYVLANRIANRINPSRQEAANKELFTALETGDVQKATEWIKKGADVNDLSSPPVRRTDPLRMVARSGYRTLVSLLLANGAMIKGGTPLHEAAAKGDEKAVMLFCANRASINAKDEENWQPLNWAMACGHKGIAEILIANGAEVDGNLEFAMGLGHVDDVEMLLSHSANVNSADCRGETPLHKAANMKSIRFAELLIARGADVNAVDAFGRTPLSEAVYGGFKDIVELLIAKGANVNVTDRDGFVPLHLLSGMNFGGDCPRGEIARILIRNGANVNVVSFCCGKA